MPKSIASGRFAHDGANQGPIQGNGEDSGAESDHGSASHPTADRGSSIQLFPPSAIAPFIVLSQTGPVMSAPTLVSESLQSSLPALPPSSSSAPPIQYSESSVISPHASSSFRVPSVTPVHHPSSIHASSSSLPSVTHRPLPMHASTSSSSIFPSAEAPVQPPPPSAPPSSSGPSHATRSAGKQSTGKQKQSAVPDPL